MAYVINPCHLLSIKTLKLLIRFQHFCRQILRLAPPSGDQREFITLENEQVWPHGSLNVLHHKKQKAQPLHVQQPTPSQLRVLSLTVHTCLPTVTHWPQHQSRNALSPPRHSTSSKDPERLNSIFFQDSKLFRNTYLESLHFIPVHYLCVSTLCSYFSYKVKQCASKQQDLKE